MDQSVAKIDGEEYPGYATILKSGDSYDWQVVVSTDEPKALPLGEVLFEGEFRYNGRKTTGKGKASLDKNTISEAGQTVIFEGLSEPELEKKIY